MTFGPGSVVDFRADGAPVSAIAAGLEEWDRSFPPAGLANPQTNLRNHGCRESSRWAVSGCRLSSMRTGGTRDGNADHRSARRDAISGMAAVPAMRPSCLRRAVGLMNLVGPTGTAPAVRAGHQANARFLRFQSASLQHVPRGT